MTKPYIKYKSGYKYQLVEEYRVKVSAIPENNVKTDYLELNTEGMRAISEGVRVPPLTASTCSTTNLITERPAL